MSGQCSGYQASPSHVGSTSSPTPSSRFTVRYVHGFCLMLPPDTPFLKMPLPCWRRPSVRSRRTILFPTLVGNGGLCVMPGTHEEPRSKLTGYRRVRRVSVVGHLLWGNLAVGHNVPPSASWRARQLSQRNTHPTKILLPIARA